MPCIKVGALRPSAHKENGIFEPKEAIGFIRVKSSKCEEVGDTHTTRRVTDSQARELQVALAWPLTSFPNLLRKRATGAGPAGAATARRSLRGTLDSPKPSTGFNSSILFPPSPPPPQSVLTRFGEGSTAAAAAAAAASPAASPATATGAMRRREGDALTEPRPALAAEAAAAAAAAAGPGRRRSKTYRWRYRSARVYIWT